MKRLVYLLMLVATVLAACGGSSEVAATIDGAEVTVGEVEGLIDSGDESVISKAQFAQFLGFLIQWRIVEAAAAAEFGIEIDEADVTAEADRIFSEAADPGTSREDFLAANGVTEEFLLQVAHQQLLDKAVRERFQAEIDDPSSEQIDARLADAALELAEVCLSHLLVETEGEAEAALDRVDAGETFADLAAELSLDTGSGAEGGDLGCSAPSRYVPEFAEAAMAAELDVVTGPVETSFGFHLILVTERTEADPAELPAEAELIEALRTEAVGQAVNSWFLEKVGAAEVTISEKFGTWETEPSPRVVPPAE